MTGGRAPKPVICIDHDGTFYTFESLWAGAQATDCNPGNIHRSCTHGGHARGRMWVFADDVYIKDNWLYYKKNNKPVERPAKSGKWKKGRWAHGQTTHIDRDEWEQYRDSLPKPWRPDECGNPKS